MIKNEGWNSLHECYEFETDIGGALLHKDRRVEQGGKLTM